jgi:hypothetical protein
VPLGKRPDIRANFEGSAHDPIRMIGAAVGLSRAALSISPAPAIASEARGLVYASANSGAAKIPV